MDKYTKFTHIRVRTHKNYLLLFLKFVVHLYLMEKRIRIIDIAKKAGVSKGTVDRVLHNRGNVSESAKTRVLRVVEDMNYQRNHIASALAYNKSWRIAALLPNPETDVFWQYPQKGILIAKRLVQDYGISIDHYHFEGADTAEFLEKSEQILRNNYHAVLVAPIFLKEASYFLDKCKENGIFYVQINTYVERHDPYFLCYIGQNSYYSGRLGAKLLHLCMSPDETAMVLHLEKSVINSMHLIDKEKGFEHYFQEMPNTKIQVLKNSFHEVSNKKEFRAFIEREIQRTKNLKGIFVTTSRIFHLIEILEQIGTTDIKLVGFDLIPQNMEYLSKNKVQFLINQNPLKQGYLGIINIFQHFIFKKQIEKSQYLPLDIVVKENADFYHRNEAKLHLVL